MRLDSHNFMRKPLFAPSAYEVPLYWIQSLILCENLCSCSDDCIARPRSKERCFYEVPPNPEFKLIRLVSLPVVVEAH